MLLLDSDAIGRTGEVLATGSRKSRRRSGNAACGGVHIKAHKQNNIRRALTLIRRRDTFSVAEISHEVRLSKTTVKKTIDLLSAMKLVLSAGQGGIHGGWGEEARAVPFQQELRLRHQPSHHSGSHHRRDHRPRLGHHVLPEAGRDGGPRPGINPRSGWSISSTVSWP